MKQDDNIIQIRQRDIRQADKAFAEFMSLTENYFNQNSASDPKLYKNVSPSDLEVLTLKTLRELSSATPFRADEIKLVSGHSFPDIVAETFFGVEVKSTKSDKWISTGSSIVESTRNHQVDNIYMFFGKLGGTPPQFRCRPYQDCLSNIAVTHSPRYMIDMTLKDKGGQTIFDKLNVSYNEFYKRDDKIDLVRNYYIDQSLEKEELPWWVGRNNIDDSIDVASKIGLISNCSILERNKLKAQMVVLFPEVINGNYKKAALWLCTCKGLLDLNLRDSFSSGGQWRFMNGEVLAIPLPAILGTLQKLMPLIEEYLCSDCESELYGFNKNILQGESKLENWLNMVEDEFKKKSVSVQINDLDIDIKDILRNYSDYSLSR